MSVTLHTNCGDIKVEVYCDRVPRTAKNFLALAASGAYNGTIFHRNIRKFMIQGGDPTGTGKGGTSIYGRYFDDEVVDGLGHSARGVLSMANKGRPNTNSCQFFICYRPAPHLDNVNTVFGRVIHGFDVLDAMERSKVDEKNRPLREIVLERVTIHANPIADADDATGGAAT